MARRKQSTNLDFSDPTVRSLVMEQLGIEEPKPKANVLKRLTSALSFLETGNAVYKGLESGNPLEGLLQYGKDIVGGLGGAITGNVNEEKKTYSDVLDRLGVQNKIVRGVGGFIGDVALDPSTYVTFGTSGVGKIGGKGLTKEGSKILSEGLELGTRRLAREAAEKGLEKGSRAALESFAEKEGLNILNKTSTEVLRDFAEKRLTKFAEKTGADLFEKEALRFGGKELFKIGEGKGATGIKGLFDPISTGLGELGKTAPGKLVKSKASEALGSILWPVRKLFDRSAELAGEEGIYKQFTDLTHSLRETQDLVRHSSAKVGREAGLLYNAMKDFDSPEIFGYVIEKTPEDLLSKVLPPEQLSKAKEMLSLMKQAAGDTTPEELVEKLPLSQIRKNVERMQLDKLKAVDFANDPLKQVSKKFMSSDENFGKFLTATQKEAMRSEEVTNQLLRAGMIENASEVPYLGRDVLETAEGKITKSGGKGFGAESALTKERKYKYRAGGELAGVKYTTTGKKGKEAALEYAKQKWKTDMLTAKASVINDLDDKTANMVDSFGNRVRMKAEEIGEGAIKRGDYKQIRNPLTNKVMFNGDYLPKEAADITQKTINRLTGGGTTNEFLRNFDKITGFWKGSVTSYFPSFHVRNGFSNMVTNANAGITNPRFYKDAGGVQSYINKVMKEGVDSEAVKELAKKEVGKTGIPLGDFLDIVEKNGVVGSGTFYDEIEKGFNADPSKLSKLVNAPQKFGNYVEENAKLAHFIGRLEKGDSIQDAVMSVKKYLFDYGDLTDFEKNVLRRIVPFYTWARKNVELQLKEIATNPGKVGAQLKGFRDMQNAFSDIPDEDLKKLPLWARNGVEVLAEDNGNVRAVMGFGTPLEAFSATVGGFAPGATGDPSLFSSLNPVIKTPLEKTFNVSLFDQKPIDTNTDAKQFAGFLKVLPQEFKDAIGYKEVERTTTSGKKYTEQIMNPNARFYLSALFSRFLTTGGKIGTLAEGESTGTGLLDLLTGVKVRNYNLAQEEEKRNREMEDLLYKELLKRGEAKQYNRAYLTKEAQAQLQ